MRIGELLVESSITDLESLETALDYASSKSIPVGRALRALKCITEVDLQRALDAQSAIRQGLDGSLAVAALRFAHQTNRTFVQSLKKLPATAGAIKIPPGLIEFLSKPTSLEATQTRKVPKIMQMPSLNRPAEKYVMQGDQFFEANQVELAEGAYLNAKQQLDDNSDSPPGKKGMVYTKLANLYLATERYEEAAPLYQKVIELQTVSAGKISVEVVRALEDLADLHIVAENSHDSREPLIEALNLLEQLPPDLITAGRLVKKLGLSFANESNGRTRIGELVVDAHLLDDEKLKSPLAVSQATGQPLGMVLRVESLLDDQQVESIIFAQLLIKQGTLPPQAAARGLKVAAAFNVPLKQLCEAGRWVGEAMANDQQYQQLVLEQERLVTNEGILGADHPEIAAILTKIADLHLSRKDRMSAEMNYKRAMSVLEKLPQPDLLQIARLCEKMAQAHYQQAKYADALKWLMQSVEYRQNAGHSDSIDTAKILWLAAKIEILQSNYAIALNYLRRAKAIFDMISPGNCPRQLMEELAKCSAATGSLS